MVYDRGYILRIYLNDYKCLIVMRTQIILDTNFLLIPGQFKVDIFSEIDRICSFSYELVIVPETITELNEIINSKYSNNKDKKAAKLALLMIKKFKVKTLADRKVFKRADEAILQIAAKNSVVATQDRELKKKLQEKAANLIVLRQKQYLQFLS